MSRARKLLLQASQKLDLPSDVIAGVPRMELTGMDEFSVEPHKGLVEYSAERISMMTSIGVVAVVGMDLTIKRMNGARITITGKLQQVCLPGEANE